MQWCSSLEAALRACGFVEQPVGNRRVAGNTFCWTLPADVVRRQMQMVGLHGRPAMYSSTFDAVRSIWQHSGYRGPGKHACGTRS